MRPAYALNAGLRVVSTLKPAGFKLTKHVVSATSTRVNMPSVVYSSWPQPRLGPSNTAPTKFFE